MANKCLNKSISNKFSETEKGDNLSKKAERLLAIKQLVKFVLNMATN